MKSIKVEVDETGSVKVDFFGYVGDSCFQDEEKLRRVLEQFGLTVQVQEQEAKKEGILLPLTQRIKHRR